MMESDGPGLRPRAISETTAMLIKKPADIRESEVTPKDLYLRRREFIRAAGSLAAVAATAAVTPSSLLAAEVTQNPNAYRFPDLKKGGPFDTTETVNSYNDITSYNNFYEFGLDKADPARYAHTLKPRPWSVVVEGECNKPGRYDIEEFTRGIALEERIYRGLARATEFGLHSAARRPSLRSRASTSTTPMSADLSLPTARRC
jgi:hypothetical protein